MFTSLETFLPVWKGEAKASQRILDALTDECLDQAIAPGHRTIRRIAWHIAQTIPEMMGRTGLELEGPDEHEPPPATAAEIAAAHKRAASSLADQLVKRWTDESLSVEDDMYGEKWPRGRSLGALVLHQAHHRGQLTVLMRQAGVAVPGIYGPSLEGWAQYGMAPPEV
jgi:uncharacterized damage-inducible protein DinB